MTETVGRVASVWPTKQTERGTNCAMTLQRPQEMRAAAMKKRISDRQVGLRLDALDAWWAGRRPQPDACDEEWEYDLLDDLRDARARVKELEDHVRELERIAESTWYYKYNEEHEERVRLGKQLVHLREAARKWQKCGIDSIHYLYTENDSEAAGHLAMLSSEIDEWFELNEGGVTNPTDSCASNPGLGSEGIDRPALVEQCRACFGTGIANAKGDPCGGCHGTGKEPKE